MSNVTSLKGVRELPKSTPKSMRSTTEAVILTRAAVELWHAPPFQRPLVVNAKVMALAETLKTGGGIIPGILTIGVHEGTRYLADGQHRVEAFKISELPEAYAEIRICHFETMADMAEEFVNINSKLVAMRPDDILRGLEATSAGLAYLRKHAPYVGYTRVRSGANSPVISASSLIRAWYGSAHETPVLYAASATAIVKMLTEEEAKRIVQFLAVAHSAWGSDEEYYRLWGSLNLTLVMWLWRRTVLDGYSAKSVRLTPSEFQKCLMSLSASTDYLDWLLGRVMREHDRSPCYRRIRDVFQTRIAADNGKRAFLPAPQWFNNSGSR